MKRCNHKPLLCYISVTHGDSGHFQQSFIVLFFPQFGLLLPPLLQLLKVLITTSERYFSTAHSPKWNHMCVVVINFE